MSDESYHPQPAVPWVAPAASEMIGIDKSASERMRIISPAARLSDDVRLAIGLLNSSIHSGRRPLPPPLARHLADAMVRVINENPDSFLAWVRENAPFAGWVPSELRWPMYPASRAREGQVLENQARGGQAQ